MGIRREEKQLRTLGVYIHIPFCVSKCPYCDFKSVVIASAPEPRYARCLQKELSSIKSIEGLEKGRPLESIYIGGGTPSLFSPEVIGYIIRTVKEGFTPADSIEVTVEVNPDTVDLEKLKGYRQAGVNRLSIGLQSLDNECLRSLGRPHGMEKGLAAFAQAREAGFTNVGVDIIFGVPHQSADSWRRTLEGVTALKPEHVSVYGLTIEESTPYYVLFKGYPGKKELPTEEEEIKMYRSAMSLLTEAGYSHYEISNLALPGFEGVHNTRYWLGLDYIGLGASAHSYLYYPHGGKRWWNEPSPYTYMKAVEETGQARAGQEELSRAESMQEALMLGLRMLKRGVSGEEFKERFGVYPGQAFKGWEGLERQGLLKLSKEDILLTDEGALLSNEVFMRIYA